MPSLNHVTIIGHLGRDPETRHMQNGDAVCNFSVATSEHWKDKSGAPQERTEWHNIVAWKAQATFAEEYFRKGHLVLIEGKLQTRTWDKDGVKQYRTEINAFRVSSLERREQTGQRNNAQGEAPFDNSDEPSL